ncbi:adhesion G protein-coupled receptor E3 [Danio rerio]|uniref:Adhesion G protein-coupled receptor E3 isoform X1 n=3 Tax=Danio rerio TaxID=7955 RepID=A0A8M2BIB7_DANRE
MVGPSVTLDETPRLNTTDSSMDIDLIGIANNNNGSAAVAFMSYTTMENLLKPDFFNPQNNMMKTMMSTVISATLPKTTDTALTKPVNLTFRHIREFDPRGSLSCVYWNISEWIVDGCSVVNTNGIQTVCSCVHLSTFALVQTRRPSPEINSMVVTFVIIGVLSSILILTIFGLCCCRPLRDRICGHSICIRMIPKGYSREELSSTTQSASDVFTLNSNPTEASTTIK